MVASSAASPPAEDAEAGSAGRLRWALLLAPALAFLVLHARALPYESATAAAYGLPREEALRALTLYPAEILGVGDRLGSIEVGKIANLIVTDGDPLAITTRVVHLVIDGREVSTDNRHRSLYERYRARP